jgi:hypothetical protein
VDEGEVSIEVAIHVDVSIEIEIAVDVGIPVDVQIGIAIPIAIEVVVGIAIEVVIAVMVEVGVTDVKPAVVAMEAGVTVEAGVTMKARVAMEARVGVSTAVATAMTSVAATMAPAMAATTCRSIGRDKGQCGNGRNCQNIFAGHALSPCWGCAKTKASPPRISRAVDGKGSGGAERRGCREKSRSRLSSPALQKKPPAIVNQLSPPKHQ